MVTTRRGAMRLLSVLCASAAGAAACAKKPPPPMGPPQVGVITLRSEPVILSNELPGRTVAFLTSDVRPQVNGIIKTRSFIEGALVHAGQALYQIDPAPYRATYDQAVAQVASAKANVVTAQLKAQRYASLLKLNAVSRQDYDDAEAAYLQDAATVQQYVAAAEAARINLDYTRVTAPISGRIGRSSVTPGALVTASQTTSLATITNLDKMYVDVVQSSDDSLRLRGQLAHGALSAPGAQSARVTLTLSDGAAYPNAGDLRFAEPQVDATTGSTTLRAIFPNPAGVLLPGMYVRESIAQAVDRQAILAPQRAVVYDPQGRPTALVVDQHDVTELRILTTDRAIGDKWLVTSGLKPGDRLVVDGLIKVQKPGQHVKPVPFDPAHAAPQAGGGGAADAVAGRAGGASGASAPSAH